MPHVLNSCKNYLPKNVNILLGQPVYVIVDHKIVHIYEVPGKKEI